MEEEKKVQKKTVVDKEMLQHTKDILAAANYEFQKQFIADEIEKRKKLRGVGITLIQTATGILAVPGEDRVNTMTAEELHHFYSPHDLETKLRLLTKFDAYKEKSETLSMFLEEKKQEKEVRLRFLLKEEKEKQ